MALAVILRDGYLSLAQFLLCHWWWCVLETSPRADLHGVLGREQHAEGRLFEWGVEHPLDPLRRIRSAGPRTQPWSGLTPSRPPETQLQAHSIPSHGISTTTSFAQGKHGSKELGALRIHPISHCSPSSQSATRLQEL